MSCFRRIVGIVLAGLCIGIAAIAAGCAASSEPARTIVVNPYEGVDWSTVQHHRAALHVHTLQSDGHHRLEEVLAAYHKAGFTILSITDHDNMKPNRHVEGGRVPKEQASPFPDPKPADYPANTTWPWADFGGPAPQDLGMVGIEGNELSYRHHINSFFNGFGAPDREMDEDALLLEVKKRGGLAFLNHPGIDANWWTRQPVEWYVERFQKHGPDYLVGIEVTNCSVPTEKYDEGLWDQLLARFMPHRPIWGFGTDDMHTLNSVRESDAVFPLNRLSEANVRLAMETGRFYFRKSSRRDDFRQRRRPEELFPQIKAIRVDAKAGTITIDASNYDTIKWISAPESLEPQADYKTSNAPWPLGRVVHVGKTLNYRQTPGIGNYVRVELHRRDGEDLFRTFTNPFGFAAAQ
ncbi:PHP domain-containing protein [Anaerobaca lacustris]|uniref:Polymerase/histidinol phosphatase N-terminal domain-containing protein n=1 Tax=Anaerobaca lacustris TaxID=3044600 RepID=A0AAW6U5R4_9BACT|nr:hypothetical protein [Sedimentisphaerales bacterium M17dextr]